MHGVFTAKPGKQGALREALAAAAAATKEHAGVLSYQFYTSADGRQLVALETYKDLESLTAHMAGLGDGLSALMALVDEMTMNVFGDVPDQVKAGMQAFAPSFYDHLAGFTVGA